MAMSPHGNTDGSKGIKNCRQTYHLKDPANDMHVLLQVAVQILCLLQEPSHMFAP